MAASRGPGCFKALNAPVTLAVQLSTFVYVSLSTQYCMFLIFNLCTEEGRSEQQHFGTVGLFKSEGVVWI